MRWVEVSDPLEAMHWDIRLLGVQWGWTKVASCCFWFYFFLSLLIMIVRELLLLIIIYYTLLVLIIFEEIVNSRYSANTGSTLANCTREWLLMVALFPLTLGVELSFCMCSVFPSGFVK